MKNYLIEKYELYIKNLEWHLETNEEEECMLRVINARLHAYREILTDLRMIPDL